MTTTLFGPMTLITALCSIGALSACSECSDQNPDGAAEPVSQDGPVLDSAPEEYGAAALRAAAGLATQGFGQFSFETVEGYWLRAFYYRATGFDSRDGRILFVQHGAGRNADGYVARAAPLAERHDALVVGIEFTEEAYPHYHVPVTRERVRRLDPSEWPPVERRVCAELPRLYEAVRDELENRVGGYWAYGHSGGAQFIHRTLMFCPDSRLRGVVIANAGWYTWPSFERTGVALDVPFGLSRSPLTPDDLRRILSVPLVVLIGDRDTAHHSTEDSVCSAAGCVAQGDNRFERAHGFFSQAQTEADRLGVDLAWRLFELPGIGHEGGAALAAAGQFLFGPGTPPCESTRAADADGIVLNEILINPRGDRADANNDGVVDGADEFVELVNRGSTSVCVGGWSLHDADGERRRLPLGMELAPGESLVAFGRAVPIGDFGGAKLSWSLNVRSVGLSDRGDVFRLADVAGTTVVQLSWGDCGGENCAEEHVDTRLRPGLSWVRLPELWGEFVDHPTLGQSTFSPGTTRLGRPFTTE